MWCVISSGRVRITSDIQACLSFTYVYANVDRLFVFTAWFAANGGFNERLGEIAGVRTD